ncbi:2-phosphosulfolactate phosphatase [Virgibacillus byunsanensis]|uniref:Probable 2-phosphosulfolactate phosphatase n=1 Tax=Virgibacillus byunsanensis TaxID=570945 RepID=A0ABW3LP70_9BACI
MEIKIDQGSDTPTVRADITIVIDVIRAFTVAHYAFLQGAKRIFLAETVEQAILIKKANPTYLLAGEIDGLAIKGFDLENSPYRIQQTDLSGKTLVLKTTNGVRGALRSLSSDHIFVTGLTNARKTADFIRENMTNEKETLVQIMATHPSGDDDLACAEYIKNRIEDTNLVSEADVIERVKKSHVAEKFFDTSNDAFIVEDIFYCIKRLHSDFVMKVSKTGEIPMIVRVYV